MSIYDQLENQLEELDAFVAGGQPEPMVAAAEAKLGVTFPPSFRTYLHRWGNLSIDDVEYYGLTRNDDFDNAAVPNFVWFTLRKRKAVGLPDNLLVFRNINDEVYVCIDTNQPLPGDERRVVTWDNVDRVVDNVLDRNFAEYLADELTEIAEEQ